MLTETVSTDLQNTEENVITISTRTPEELVANWGRENMISAGTVDKLFEEGFTSLEALKLVDDEDLSKVKIPRGQKKLTLSCVQTLTGGHTAERTTMKPPAAGKGITQTSVAEEERAPRLESARNTTDQSASRGVSHDGQYGGALSPLSTSDSYVNGLLNQLARGQVQTQNEIPRDLATRQTLLSDNNISIVSGSPLSSG